MKELWQAEMSEGWRDDMKLCTAAWHVQQWLISGDWYLWCCVMLSDSSYLWQHWGELCQGSAGVSSWCSE